MIDLTAVLKINDVIEEYFIQNPTLKIVPVKALMPSFIEAGIFTKDYKKGFPIRSILKELDKKNELDRIPFVYAERNGTDTYWYFIPKDSPTPTTPYKQDKIKEPKSISDRFSNSDETYVINLCDKVLGLIANRMKRFDFLLGDFHKDGFTRTKLPVDAYYENLELVIEYMETKPEITEIPDEFEDDKEDEIIHKPTRNEQRKIYEKRRAKVLPKNDINLVVITYTNFSFDDENKIIRNELTDLKIVEKILESYLTIEQK